MFDVTQEWKSAFPDSCVGVLVMRDAVNTSGNPELEKQKTEIEEALRAQFAGQDRAMMSSIPVLQAYNTYYKQFKKSYHVQLQLESIVWKGKSIPSVSALVQAMFMAEVKNMLLTAGHDLDTLQLPLTLDVSKGTETYPLMRGEEQTLKAGDMFIRDQAGIISNIIYGPDKRTQITPNTKNVIFTVYAPAGIDPQAVTDHLKNIQEYVSIAVPQARVESLDLFG